MKLTNTILMALITVASALQAREVATIQDGMIQDLSTAKYTFSLKYAPDQWKSQYLGWSLEDAFQDAVDKVREGGVQNSSDYRKIFKTFVGSTKDYHVRALFYSTECSVFPLNVKSAKGRYFITDKRINLYSIMGVNFDPVDNFAQVADNLNKIKAGDEIIAINGASVKDEIERLIDNDCSGDRTPTGYALAERMLFARSSLYGYETPVGTFTITLIHKGSTKPKTYTFPWLHIPEMVKKRNCLVSEEKDFVKKMLNREFCSSLAKEFLCKRQGDVKEFASTNDDKRSKGFLPKLGPILWESEIGKASEIYAYQYLNEGKKKVGYLYIPDFVNNSMAFDSQVIEDLITLLKKIQQDSDALVLDITDNPGGSLLYMYAILSLLSDKPLVAPLEIEKLTHEDIFYAVQMKLSLQDSLESDKEEEIGGYSITKKVMEQMIGYCDHLIDTWNSGETVISPHPLLGIDTIEPNARFQFKKPILLITNELDFSCADVFPAILQDNGRARIFGKKTAGAGGSVRMFSQNSGFGVLGYSLTCSIAYRADGSTLENLGVTPDVEYELTVNDLKNGYCDYIRAVNAEVLRLVNEKN